MRVVDSSAWIEWLAGTSTGAQIGAEIPDTENCVVPTIVQLELAKWMTREQGEERAYEVIAYTMTCRVAPLYTPIALMAAEMSKTLKLAMADAIIYATAIEYGADLLTCDEHFKGLPHVLYVEK